MFEILFWVIFTLAVVFGIVYFSRKVEIIIGLYASMVVVANVLATKITVFLWWEVDAGTIVYAALFFLIDILSEYYGKKYAKRAVWAGFAASVVYVVSVWIAIGLEPSTNWGFQGSFVDVFANSWRIVLASMIAYLISQNYNIWSYNKLKKLTGGRFLWLRNNVSTMTSQGIDSVLFASIAFYGLFPIGGMIVGLWLFKVTIAILDTPFLYLARILR